MTMPEGDTLYRTATVLREVLLGRAVTAARGRPGRRAAGARHRSTASIDREMVGKHLLIGFDGGLSLHTHLGMNGSWHRYRPGERWRRSPARAVCVIETRDCGRCVLRRARGGAHRDAGARSASGLWCDWVPTSSMPEPDVAAALTRLGDAGRSDATIAEALARPAQRWPAWATSTGARCCSSSGSIRSSRVGAVEPAVRERLVRTGARLLRANRDGPRRTTTGTGRGRRATVGLSPDGSAVPALRAPPCAAWSSASSRAGCGGARCVRPAGAGGLATVSGREGRRTPWSQEPRGRASART